MSLIWLAWFLLFVMHEKCNARKRIFLPDRFLARGTESNRVCTNKRLMPNRCLWCFGFSANGARHNDAVVWYRIRKVACYVCNSPSGLCTECARANAGATGLTSGSHQVGRRVIIMPLIFLPALQENAEVHRVGLNPSSFPPIIALRVYTKATPTLWLCWRTRQAYTLAKSYSGYFPHPLAVI